MLISLKVKSSAKLNKVEKFSNVSYKVWVTAPAEKGKANQAVVEFLADYFKVKKSQVSIVAGLKSREKVVRVDS